MAKMTYLGHGSLRFMADNGKVIYVDPYWGDDYGVPADVILVTHQHSDHNQVEKVTKKPDCRIITDADALEGGKHNSFDLGYLKIDSVLADNKNHSPKSCVGYVLTIDDKKVYCSGDTSYNTDMDKLSGIDYALLPIDGIYNMDAEEATRCAGIIGAKHSIPIHTDPSGYLEEKVDKFTATGKLAVKPGETISL